MAAERYSADLRRRATQYERLIEQFERVRTDLLKRRTQASDSEGVTIDERLQLNDRTLKSVREELKVAKEEIKRLARGGGMRGTTLVTSEIPRPPTVQRTVNTRTTALRNVYTVEQFATEILCGNLSADWVRDQIKAKKIKALTKKPVLIPMSEAARFISGK